ncbi:amidohydrolase 2 [Mycobacterium colombiense CECT 3035]|uniref:Amidohydrolase 2 n=1 Tax=Mycobacterium colombiense CECT 3035 TaxID=1041522 RepID=J4TKX2_9MYCO|nr:amidohydrolase 2 [Mycobacterium colombiense CECT 3035]
MLTVLDVYREPMTGITGFLIDAVGPEDAVRVVGGNIKRFLGIPA